MTGSLNMKSTQLDGGFLGGAQRYCAPVRGLAYGMANWIAVLPFFMPEEAC